MNRNWKPYSRNSCCWNCQAPGHKASECPEEKRLFCSHCLNPGTTTFACGCKRSSNVVQLNNPLPADSIHKYPVCNETWKVRRSPLYIYIGDECFESYVNTFNEQTQVGWVVAVKASIVYGTKREFRRTPDAITSEVLIPLNFKGKIRTIRCTVTDSPNNIITLGLDALLCFGSTLTLAGLTNINFAGCPDLNHQTVYDIPILREVNAAKHKTGKPSVPKSIRPKNPIDLSACCNPGTSKDMDADIVTEQPIMSWAEMVINEPANDMDRAAREYVMSLNDEEIDEYLKIDTDESDLSK